MNARVALAIYVLTEAIEDGEAAIVGQRATGEYASSSDSNAVECFYGENIDARHVRHSHVARAKFYKKVAVVAIIMLVWPIELPIRQRDWGLHLGGTASFWALEQP